MTCCHLSGDVRGREALRPFQEFTGDCFDDGSVVLNVALCTDCVVKFCVADQVALNSQTLECADPAPVCPECWRTLSTSILVKPHC
jgi:hypothetical protein